MLLSLACVLVSFLTDYQFTRKYTDKGTIYESRYGLWTTCETPLNIGGVEKCYHSRELGHSLSSVYDGNVIILYICCIGLYLPSLIGVLIIIIQVDVLVLTVLGSITITGSIATGLAALGIFTSNVVNSSIKDVVYSWSYILGWFGIILLILTALMLSLCIARCQWTINNSETDELRLQTGQGTSKGLFNPSYVPGQSMKARRIERGEDDFHFNLANVSNFFPAEPIIDPSVQPHDGMILMMRAKAQPVGYENQGLYHPSDAPGSAAMVSNLIPYMGELEEQLDANHNARDTLDLYTISEIVPDRAAGTTLEMGDTFFVSVNKIPNAVADQDNQV